MEKILRKVYYDLESPACYAGIDKVWTEAKKYDQNITRENVSDFLSSQSVYTLYKPLRKKFSRMKTVPSGLHTDWQCDLAIFDSIKQHNDGYRYLLVCIDVLSRKLFVAPARSKKSEDMIEAFEKVFKKSIYRPWKLMSDRGVEFVAKKMMAYFKDNEIMKFSMYTHPYVHAGVVERANRTIKERLYKYFENKNTERWIDIIDKIVNAINNSVNVVTGVKPNSVTFKNAEILRKKLYKQQVIGKTAKFKVGDIVRTSVTRGVFDKGYLANYSDELFTVYQINNTQPITYTLKDYDKNIIIGKYYDSELVKAPNNIDFRVEKVLRSRIVNGEKEYLIKWKGYSSKHNSWLNEKYMKD